MTTGRLTAVLAAGQRQRRLASTGAPEPQNLPDNEVAWAAFLAETQASEARAAAHAARAQAAQRKGALAEKEGMLAEKRGERAANDAMEAAEATRKARERAEAWVLEANADLQTVVAETAAENTLRASNAAAWAMLAFMAAEGEWGLVKAQSHKAEVAATRGRAAHKISIAASKEAREAAAEAREEVAATAAAATAARAAATAARAARAATTDAEN